MSITRNGEYYYIGTESSGKVFVYSTKEGDVIDTLNTDYGRIYQVKKLHETDTFFVGTQNMGLKKTHQHGDSLITDIPYKIKGKGDRYSCYDIFFDNDTVYAMTSHGIYYVGKSDTLQSVFPKHDQNGVPNPLVANNMVKANGYLFAATDLGIVVIKNHKVVNTIAVKIKMKNVACHDSFIYALGDCLYKVDPDSLKVVDTIKLKASARYYFYADSIHHFLSDSYMVLTHDSVLYKPEQHKQVDTRRKLSLEGHNVIADGKEYSLLVAENALWQVGHHYPSVFGNLKKEGGVKLACTVGKLAYFLVGKKIYKLSANNVAEEVLELKENGEIKLMECNLNGDSIYYANNGDSVFRQSLKQGDSEFIGKSDKEITAMCVHNSVPGVILGVRDGVLCMDKTQDKTKIDTIKLRTGKGDVIPYLRRFAVVDSVYYIPTMNDGLFKGKGKEANLILNTENLQYIRDVVCTVPTRYETLDWITNDSIYLNNTRLYNDNYGSRLLFSNLTDGYIAYIPGQIGGVRVIKYNDKSGIKKDSILLPDVAFRAESCVKLDDVVYLGGDDGIITLNKELQYHYVQLIHKKEKTYFWIIWVAVGLLTLALMIILVRKANKAKEDAAKQANSINLSKIQSEYKDLANKNYSKVEEIETNEDSIAIEKYKELLENEKEFERYKNIFEEKKEKILDVAYSIAYTITFEKNTEGKGIPTQMYNGVKKFLGKKTAMTSKDKIEGLDEIIMKNHKSLIDKIAIHIKNKLNIITEQSKKKDKEILERIKEVYEQQKGNVEKYTDNIDTKALFKIIEETTINDGRLEMVVQMGKIREVLNSEINAKELQKVINNFYSPAIAYRVDNDMYDELISITKNERDSPKRIRGNGNLTQQPFVILAVAMAKQQLPEDCKDFFDRGTDEYSINRAKGFVYKWLNNDSSKLTETIGKVQNQNPNSVTAYYLLSFAKSKHS